MQSVFRLKSMIDNPYCRQFGWGNAPSLLGKKFRHSDFSTYATSPDFTIPSLKNVWDRPQLANSEFVYPEIDFPGILGAMVVSKRAVDALSGFLGPTGELLPVQTDFGEYFVFHLTEIVSDALDLLNSEYTPKDRVVPLSVHSYSFHPDAIEELTIFRAREYPTPVLVTKTFVDRCIETGLLGLHFEALWPDEALDIITGPASPIDHDNETVTIEYSVPDLAAEASSPNDGTSELLRSTAMSFQARLKQSLSSPYLGQVEGCESVGTRNKFLVSCPKAERAFEAIGSSADSLPFESLVLMHSEEWWNLRNPDAIFHTFV